MVFPIFIDLPKLLKKMFCPSSKLYPFLCYWANMSYKQGYTYTTRTRLKVIFNRSFNNVASSSCIKNITCFYVLKRVL